MGGDSFSSQATKEGSESIPLVVASYPGHSFFPAWPGYEATLVATLQNLFAS